MEIESKRLLMRPHTLSDLPSSHHLWNCPEVFQFISGKPSSEQQSAGRLYNYLGHWQLHGYGYLAVVDKHTGAFMGEVGVANFFRDINPKIDCPFEVGWVLAPSYHGKGFAREAVEALLQWHQAKFSPQNYWCMIDPRNSPSLKLASLLGFHFTHEANYNGERLHVLQT